MAVFAVAILALMAATYFPSSPAVHNSNSLFPLKGITFVNINGISGSKVAGQLGLNLSEPAALQFYIQQEKLETGSGNSSAEVLYTGITPLWISFAGRNFSFAIPDGWNGSTTSLPTHGPATKVIAMNESSYPSDVPFSVWLSIPSNVQPGYYMLILTVLGWSQTDQAVIQYGNTVQAPVQTGLVTFSIDLVVH